MNVYPRKINEIVQGKRSITADTALRLARFFGTSPELEMLLEWRDEAVGQQRYPVLRREPDPEVFWGVVPS